MLCVFIGGIVWTNLILTGSVLCLHNDSAGVFQDTTATVLESSGLYKWLANLLMAMQWVVPTLGLITILVLDLTNTEKSNNWISLQTGTVITTVLTLACANSTWFGKFCQQFIDKYLFGAIKDDSCMGELDGLASRFLTDAQQNQAGLANPPAAGANLQAGGANLLGAVNPPAVGANLQADVLNLQADDLNLQVDAGILQAIGIDLQAGVVVPHAGGGMLLAAGVMPHGGFDLFDAQVCGRQ